MHAIGYPANCPAAVLHQAGRFFRDSRGKVTLVFLWSKLICGQKGNLLLQHAGVPRRLDVFAYRVGQPEKIIAATGAHPGRPLGQLVPPMKHVPLFKLARRAAQQMLAGVGGIEQKLCAAVLQLIAKPPCARALIKTGSRSQAGVLKLQGKPGIDHMVHRGVGGGDADGVLIFQNGGLPLQGAIPGGARRRLVPAEGQHKLHLLAAAGR